MSLFVGIIGLPNVGKSTLFNALTQGSAQASNYPFCTVEPNVGVVEVPDPRLQELARILRPESAKPTSIRFVDIAGLVRGASRGEGLGNQFLGHVREADALVHVLRCFADQQVAHVDGQVDPLRDLETVETELLLADLEVVDHALPRLDKVVRTDPRSPQRLETDTLLQVQDGLRRGTPVHRMGHPPEQTHAIGGYHLLTAKPVLYVANVGEQEASAPCPRFERLAEKVGAQRVLRIAAQIEAEIAQLPPADRAGFLADLGLAETGIDRLIVAAYRLLDLITFYTVAHDRLQAWQVRRGALAPAAAGRIHTEMERGFIRAEVATFADLVRSGSWARLRESGSLRTEGHDYPVADGDVVHFLFKP